MSGGVNWLLVLTTVFTVVFVVFSSCQSAKVSRRLKAISGTFSHQSSTPMVTCDWHDMTSISVLVLH